jgi:hypothetical protein
MDWCDRLMEKTAAGARAMFLARQLFSHLSPAEIKPLARQVGGILGHVPAEGVQEALRGLGAHEPAIASALPKLLNRNSALNLATAGADRMAGVATPLSPQKMWNSLRDYRNARAYVNGALSNARRYPEFSSSETVRDVAGKSEKLLRMMWKNDGGDVDRLMQLHHDPKFVSMYRQFRGDLPYNETPTANFLEAVDPLVRSQQAQYAAATHNYEQAKRDASQLAPEWDRLATSGRHGGSVGLPSTDPAMASAPTEAYKGFSVDASAGPPAGPPSAAGSNYGQTRPYNVVAAGQPSWWSGYSDVAAGYAHAPWLHGSPSYVAKTPVSSLQAQGPHTPIFTPHVAVDSRNMDLPAVQALSQFSLAGNGEWASRPYYERVFTQATQPFHMPEASIYKNLPSGTGFQMVKPPVAGQAKLGSDWCARLMEGIDAR